MLFYDLCNIKINLKLSPATDIIQIRTTNIMPLSYHPLLVVLQQPKLDPAHLRQLK